MTLRFAGATLAALLFSCAAVAQTAPADPAFSPEAFRAHVAFLADDVLEGRDAGTRGYDVAARYVATRFDALGLKPAVNGTMFQTVTLVKAELDSAAPPVVTIGGIRFTNATTAAGGDVLVGPYARETDQTVTAPAVFAGFGIDAPAQGFNDYAGLDVKGKFVVVLSGFPKGMPSEVGAHLNAEKAAMAEKRGAIGVITIPTKEFLTRRPWAQTIANGSGPSYTWVGTDGQPYVRAPGIRATAVVNLPAAQALFARSSRTLAAVRDAADRKGGKPRGFDLRQDVTIARKSTVTQVKSDNVIGIIPGSDPALANEYVLLMAHLDHNGVRPKPDGSDGIYNGALDNASGTATMLEVAKAFAESGVKPKRSLLFAAVTAEEDGLLGSQYLAKHPVVGDGKVVGVVNLDMPILLYDFTDVIAFGAEHSTLGPIVRKAAARANVALSPDPLPAEGLFTRSDHYRFVQEGVPSVFLMTGFAGEGAKQFEGFLATHYHKPSDDMNLPINWQAGAKFANINYLIAREIANSPAKPLWYKDSFFGNVFGGDQPRADRAKGE